MECIKAKYKVGTRVRYKINNPNIPMRTGTIINSYYSSYGDKVYYTIKKDDDSTQEIPEEIINSTVSIEFLTPGTKVLLNARNGKFIRGVVTGRTVVDDKVVYTVYTENKVSIKVPEQYVKADRSNTNTKFTDDEEDYGDEG